MNKRLKESSELQDLINHQKEISEWLASVKYRIHELETSYLDEPNSLGNIVKGWDPDGRLGPIKKQPIEDKDRLFSNSSYQVFMEMKAHQELEAEKKLVNIKTENQGIPKSQLKQKKQSLNPNKKMSLGQLAVDTEWEYADY